MTRIILGLQYSNLYANMPHTLRQKEVWYKMQLSDNLVLTVPSEVLVRVFLKMLLQEKHINNATYMNAMRELDRKAERRK